MGNSPSSVTWEKKVLAALSANNAELLAQALQEGQVDLQVTVSAGQIMYGRVKKISRYDLDVVVGDTALHIGACCGVGQRTRGGLGL